MTRTEELCGLLRQRIESGEFSPGDRFPSEYILAEEYAVNHKTANKAVFLLESQGYVKRGPRGAGTLVVRNQIFPRDLILFISRFSLFHARLLKGVQKAASNNGYAVVVLFAQEAEEVLQMNSIKGSRIKGIVAAGAQSRLMMKSGIPMFAVDFDSINSYPDIHSVNTDNYAGAVELMREIIRRGHREIVLYSSALFPDRKNRIKGFADIMRKTEIPDIEKRIFYGSRSDPQSAKSNLDKILRIFPETTLICCDSDDAAQSMLLALADFPEKKITVTSYGNTLDPTLKIASVEQFPERIGEHACSRLIEILENDSSPETIREQIPPSITGSRFIPDLSCSR